MNDYIVSELNEDEKNLIKKGNFIQAVKLLRERIGSTLYDAKKSCDAYRDSLPKDWQKLYETACARLDEVCDARDRLNTAMDDMRDDLRREGYSHNDTKAELAEVRKYCDELRGKLDYATALLEKVLKVN